jgi:opacity protein-like surface antigen
MISKGGNMKKRGKVVAIAALTLLLALATAAQAAMYVEGLLGGNTAASPASGTAKAAAGWRLGYWCVPEGVLGFKYPKWMEHLGFYTDITFNQLVVNRPDFQGTGDIATWAFMAALRWGFFKDRIAPFGRLQPYVGVGIAAFLTRFPGQTSSNSSAALVMDTGVRYMLLKRLSVDLFFRYRHAEQNISYNLFSGMAGLAYHF